MRNFENRGRAVLKAGLRMVGIAVALLALAGSPVLAADEVVMKSGNVSYVSGGVGDESLERMAALAKDFNLQLLFAARTGNYLAEITVSIRDARGASVLEAVSEGPFLLARLPAGRYEVNATLDGTTVRQVTTVAATGRRQLVFRWVVPVGEIDVVPQ